MVGGLGMVAGINLGGNLLVAEPVHGTPKHLENKGIANPIAAMRAAAMIVQVGKYVGGGRGGLLQNERACAVGGDHHDHHELLVQLGTTLMLLLGQRTVPLERSKALGIQP